MKARSDKPRAASPGSKHRASVQNDVKADVNLLWQKFCELHSARLPFSWRGKSSFHESEELGFLAARGLDDVDMPVPGKYTGHDPYQREVFHSSGRIDFGTFNAADSLTDYLLLNEILTRHLREMARNPDYLANLRTRQGKT